MSISIPPRRKSKTNSFFRVPSFSHSAKSSLDESSTPTVPSSPKKINSPATPQLACLVIPATGSRDATREVAQEGTPISKLDSTHVFMSESPSHSPIAPSSPNGVGFRTSSLRRRPRPGSILGNFKSLRFTDDVMSDNASDDAKHQRTGSFVFKGTAMMENVTDISKNRAVLYHGEVQTNTGTFWKKREYLVLTETHLVRCKSHARAMEMFHIAPTPSNKRNSLRRHGSSPTIDSEKDLLWDLSGEKTTVLPLEYILAVSQLSDSKFALEVSYLDKDVGQGSSMTLQLPEAESRDAWLKALRNAANTARLLDNDPIPQCMSDYAARVVERGQDYDPSRFRIYKVAKHAPIRSSNRSSNDDLARTVSAICFLVFGIHKVHLISVPRIFMRQPSSPSTEQIEADSFGILTLTRIAVSETDDTLALTFRFPLQPAQSLHLSSLAAQEIAFRLRHADGVLRPQWLQRPLALSVPSKIEEHYVMEEPTYSEDHGCFDRTLIAFATAYDISPSDIRYTIDYDAHDSPRFELLEPTRAHAPHYSSLELLAILRALRFNETFKSLSFSGVQLNVLHEMIDQYGTEHICIPPKHVSQIGLQVEDQQSSSLLVQELRALALGSRTLSRLDVSHCFHAKSRTQNCGVLEALAPVFTNCLTNIDWLVLSGIELGQQDIQVLLDLAATKRHHFRAIEVRGCGLDEDDTALFVDSLQAQAYTLETLDVSYNKLRINPASWSRLLGGFSKLRKLDVSHSSVIPSDSPLLSFKTLSAWHLEELRLEGIPLNDASVDALCRYLAVPQSQNLCELDLGRCSLTGSHAADVMCSMTLQPEAARFLHLNISENDLTINHDRLIDAIGKGFTPTHLSMKDVEYDTDDQFENLLLTLSTNKSIRYLDISCISLPAEASGASCEALKQFFATNSTLEELRISGEHSRLEVSKLGSGIRQALHGLGHNKTLQVLHIQDQHLGVQGAATLSDVLKVNTVLRELHCENNGITLPGFTDLVNSLVDNTTLQYMPTLEEGKHAALVQTRQHIKDARTRADGSVAQIPSPDLNRLQSVRRSLGKSNRDPASRASSTRIGAAVTQWTENDVSAALRLVSGGWENQAERLQQFLERNWRLTQGLSIEEAECLAGLRERTSDEEPVLQSSDPIPGVIDSKHSSFLRSLSALSPVFERTGMNFAMEKVQMGDGLGLQLETGNMGGGSINREPLLIHSGHQGGIGTGSRSGDFMMTAEAGTYGEIEGGAEAEAEADAEPLELKIPPRIGRKRK